MPNNPTNTIDNISPISAPISAAVEPVREADQPFIWQHAESVVSCSANICTLGHEWFPTMQLTICPGCKSPMLVVKTDQCPICNEPASSLRLRSDYLPKGGAVTPICRGSATLADTHTIGVKYGHYKKEQENHIVREMPGKI